MSSHGNNGIWIDIEWKVHYKKLYAENKEIRLESQVKLHRVKIKVHGVICVHPH